MTLRPLSKSVISLSKPVFQRKYLKLGRIYKYWPQIIGEEYAEKALPIALKTRPVKSKSSQKKYDIEATLCIISSSALALPLSYQKDRIIGRIEHLFGERIVTDLKITQNHSFQKKTVANKTKTVFPKISELQDMLQNISDPELRERLEHFGQSLYQSVKQS